MPLISFTNMNQNDEETAKNVHSSAKMCVVPDPLGYYDAKDATLVQL